MAAPVLHSAVSKCGDEQRAQPLVRFWGGARTGRVGVGVDPVVPATLLLSEGRDAHLDWQNLVRLILPVDCAVSSDPDSCADRNHPLPIHVWQLQGRGGRYPGQLKISSRAAQIAPRRDRCNVSRYHRAKRCKLKLHRFMFDSMVRCGEIA